MQQGTGEVRIVAKSKPTLNLVEFIQSPGDTESSHSIRFESHTAKCRETCYWGSGQNDATSSSQVWLTDAKLSERALAAADTSQSQSFQERARRLAA